MILGMVAIGGMGESDVPGAADITASGSDELNVDYQGTKGAGLSLRRSAKVGGDH
jgi:hypothetical protein